MNARELAAADQLATATRTSLAAYIESARKIRAESGSYEEALGTLTIRLLTTMPPPAVAGLAAALLLAEHDKAQP